MLPFNQGPNFPNPQQPILLNAILQNPNPHLNPNPNFNGVNPNPYFQHANSPQLGGLLPQQLLALQFQNNLLGQIQAHSLLLAQNPLLALQNPMLGFPGSNPQVVPTANAPGVPGGPRPPQIYHAKLNSNNSSFISQNHANGSSKGKFPGVREGQSSNKRCQKDKRHDMKSPKGNMRPFNRNNKRGQHNQRGGILQSTNFGEEIRGGKLQSTNFGEEIPEVRPRYTINYPEKDIQQWREARKRNFPTKANINKKLSSGSKTNEHAAADDDKLRRQQLKEVLAKQAELGVEVAEIPPSYFRGLEGGKEMELWRETRKKNFPTRANTHKGLANDREMNNVHKRKVTDTNGTIADKSNNKRFKRKGRKSKNNSAIASPSVVKREPSLLQKLLSADIKRENSRLLQVFRFMVLNDFFKNSPDTPLKFSVIELKDDASTASGLAKDEIDREASCSQKEADVTVGSKIAGDNEVADQHKGNEDGKAEECEISEEEEGEIVD